MKKLLKVVLWIVGIVVVLIVALFGLGVYLGSGSGLAEAQKEGIAFAAKSDKEGCLSETAARLSQCDSALCMEPLNFGGLCLMNAKGDQRLFCADKPTTNSEYSKGSWLQHCSTHNLNKAKCEMLFSALSSYCRGEFN